MDDEKRQQLGSAVVAFRKTIRTIMIMTTFGWMWIYAVCFSLAATLLLETSGNHFFVVTSIVFGCLSVPWFVIVWVLHRRAKTLREQICTLADSERAAIYDERPVKHYRIGGVVLVLAYIATTAGFYGRGAYRDKLYQNSVEQLMAFRGTYSDIVHEEMDKQLRKLPYVGSVDTEADLSYKETGKGGYIWKENVKVTLHVEEDFDGLKDTDIYDYLDDLYFKSVDIMRELRSTKLTELSDIKHIINEMITEQEMGHLYSYSDAEYYVETVKNRYKYVDKRNQYLVNGVSHYTADYWKEYRQAHATPTPKPALEKLTPKPSKPKSKSSGSKKKITYGYEAYDEGYEDVWLDGDYDWDRYWRDQDYADGVDDAMEDEDW